MNGLIVPLVGRGLPLGSAQSDHDPGRADADASGGQRNDLGGSPRQSGPVGDSAIANDTAPSQSIGAPASINSTNAPAQSTTAERANDGQRTGSSPPSTNGARPLGEQAATRLFFDSLISSMTTGVDIAEIGRGQSNEEPAPPATTPASSVPNDYAAMHARDRFLEGLKLVNEPV